MSEEKRESEKEEPSEYGYQPIREGYQPTEGHLDPSNPPQGGSGVPSSLPQGGPPVPSSENGKADKKD